jgi:hypothetical protein
MGYSLRTQKGHPIVLVVGGVIFVCLGSLIDVTVYKWRLDTYRNAQAYDQESLRLKVSLTQSGIQALAETNKVIGNVTTDNPVEQRTITEEIPHFGPHDKRGHSRLQWLMGMKR